MTSAMKRYKNIHDVRWDRVACHYGLSQYFIEVHVDHLPIYYLRKYHQNEIDFIETVFTNRYGNI